MIATINEYPETLKFETAGEMCRFIEKHPAVLVMYRPADTAEARKECLCARRRS